MKMVPVTSSNIASAGYDEATRELCIEFKDGRRRVYSGVPPEVHSAFMAADSHGQFFHRAIRHNPDYTSRVVETTGSTEGDQGQGEPTQSEPASLDDAIRRFGGQG